MWPKELTPLAQHLILTLVSRGLILSTHPMYKVLNWANGTTNEIVPLWCKHSDQPNKLLAPLIAKLATTPQSLSSAAYLAHSLQSTVQFIGTIPNEWQDKLNQLKEQTPCPAKSSNN